MAHAPAAAAARPSAASYPADSLSEALQPALLLACLVAFALAAAIGRFDDPARCAWAVLAVFAVSLAVWALSRLSARAAAWALLPGCAAVVLLVVAWLQASAALCLLALPVGFIALFLGPAQGALAAVACTLLVLLAPSSLLPADGVLRTTALIALWGTVALAWVRLRDLDAAVDWSWASYAACRAHLEAARDDQVRYKQTVADLADANLQLTRLNRLADGLRQYAEDARLAKERFVANVSHELRTPLNMIIGFTEMVVGAPEMYGAPVAPALMADLEVVLRNAHHLSKLVDDVLDLSQIDARQMALARERVALAGIVQAAAVAVRPLYASKGLSLTVEVPEDLTLYCDPVRIRQVVLNLLSNAGRFTERGGVRVRAWRQGGEVVTSVEDSGPGIPPADVGRLFQPFQQLDQSIRRRFGGTGLGLSVSRGFVELHGGHMWLESEEGRGTTIFFSLPVDPPAPAEGQVSRWFSPHIQHDERTRRSLAPMPALRPRYVVLEQGDDLGRLLGRYVDGVEVAHAASLEEANAELSRTPAVSLLVNDPSVGAALERLHESGALPPGTPAMVCSLPGIAQAAGNLGVSDYLVKPVSRERLLASLDGLGVSAGTVLVVDDEPEALQLFRRMLVASGRAYRVFSATDGGQALSVLRQRPCDVVLLDLAMPNMDGFQFLEARAQDPALSAIPVVIISARDPAGQPIVCSSLAVTSADGISLGRLLACIDALSRILSTTGQAARPAPPAGPSAAPAWG